MLEWFVETTVVASGLAVVAATVSRLRSIGPTTRHMLWLVVLVKLVTPPLVCWPWAAHWGGQNWPLVSRMTAPAAPVDSTLPPPPAPARETTTFTNLDQTAGLDGLQVDVRFAPEPKQRLINDAGEALTEVTVSPRGVLDPHTVREPIARLPVGLGLGWLFLTLLVAVAQAVRITRFRGLLRAALPAPAGLVEEAERIGRCLGARPPELLIVPELLTPLLWCLGRPKLLLPAQLVKTLDLDQWRGILTHELAHIRRCDHWVSRLELAAGLIWWWNPVYWLARTRLDAEAELACDAWVVSTVPTDRLTYAEVLFNICSTLSMAKARGARVGRAGSSRFFERRLTMILHGHASCRLSPLALWAACLLVLFALPSWSTAKPVSSPNGETAVASPAPTVDPASAAAIADDDAPANDDEDDDVAENAAVAKARADFKKAQATLKKIEAESAAVAKAVADFKKAQATLKKIEADARKARADARKVRAEARLARSNARKTKTGKKEQKESMEFDFSQLGETIEKEIESKFGPEFEKKMEEFGEKFGKDVVVKLGFGSDFEKKMKELGKEMESKFGPGSDFEKKMKEKTDKLGSELQKKSARRPSSPSQGGPATDSAGGTTRAPSVVGKDRRRERRIAALEAQIRKLADELKALKADEQD